MHLVLAAEADAESARHEFNVATLKTEEVERAEDSLKQLIAEKDAARIQLNVD